MDFNSMVVDAFNGLTPDLYGIYNDARMQNLDSWQNKQLAMVAASGAAAMTIPGGHIPLMAADVAFLMNRMSVCCYGVGAIRGYDAGHGNILEEEDFPVVLAYWAGDAEIKQAVTSKAAADLAVKVGGKVGAKIIAKHLAAGAGLLVGKKIGGKLGAKLGAKIGAKLGGKLAAGFIPFLGAAVGAGINAYFINDISEAANDVYRFKCNVISKL